jgi:hypothetical protein
VVVVCAGMEEGWSPALIAGRTFSNNLIGWY